MKHPVGDGPRTHGPKVRLVGAGSKRGAHEAGRTARARGILDRPGARGRRAVDGRRRRGPRVLAERRHPDEVVAAVCRSVLDGPYFWNPRNRQLTSGASRAANVNSPLAFVARLCEFFSHRLFQSNETMWPFATRRVKTQHRASKVIVVVDDDRVQARAAIGMSCRLPISGPRSLDERESDRHDWSV